MATLDCKTLDDLEKAAFALDSNDEICKKVCDPDLLDATQGANTAGIVTEIVIDNTSWTALPTTPLVNRDGLGIQNPNNQEIKLNFATPAGYIGWAIAKQGETFLDLKDTVTIYAKSNTSSITIVIMEMT